MSDQQFNAFVELTAECFAQIIAEYRFVPFGVFRSTEAAYNVKYRSLQLCMSITCEDRDPAIDIDFIRLEQFQLPREIIWVYQGFQANACSLRHILKLRAPGYRLEELTFTNRYNYLERERLLREYAKQAILHCDDLLKGEFDIFNLLSEFYNDRHSNVDS